MLDQDDDDDEDEDDEDVGPPGCDNGPDDVKMPTCVFHKADYEGILATRDFIIDVE